MESVDTVKVILDDFSIDPGARLDIQLGIQDFATGEIRQQQLYSDGQSVIEGSKAIQNTLNYNFTLQDKAILQMSLPKILHSTNSTAINGKEAGQAFQAIEKEMATNGIHCDINKALLSRLDIFRQDITRFATTDYWPVFSMLSGKRQNKRDYGTTYLFYNTRREVAFYDKQIEEAIRQRKDERFIFPSNLMRAEARLLRKQAINNAGLMTVDSLIQDYEEAIQAVYKKEMAGVLRNSGGIDGQLCLALNGIEQEFIETKRIYGRLSVREITRIMARYGIEQLLSLYGLDSFVEMAQKHSDTINKREVKRKLLKHIQEVSIGSKAIPNKLKELFDELVTKFAE